MLTFLKNNWLFILVNLLLVFCLLIFVFWVIDQPQISVRKGRTIIKSQNSFFYLPALSPMKVYKVGTNLSKLQQLIQDDTKNSEATFGIYVKNLSTGQEVTLNPDLSFDSASLYKLEIMYAVLYRASQAKLDLNSPDINQNLHAMITYSSNDAAYWFIDQNLTSWQESTDLAHQIGMSQTFLNNGQPTTTPKDMETFLEQLADGKLISFDYSLKMLDLLSAQEVNDRIPALLPPGTLVAHKTGDLDDTIHDVGILATPDSDYILVLMSKNSDDFENTKKVMQKISFDIYNFFQNQLYNPS